MFGKKAHKKQKAQIEKEDVSEKPKIETWIGGNVNIVGDISFTGACSIDGLVEGNLSSDDPESTLILGENGVIIGNAHAANIYANGRIDGNVMASKKVELHPKARINGDLHYNLLEMAVGAGVNGKLMHQELSQAVESAELVEAKSEAEDAELAPVKDSSEKA
ncbi:MAG TPA: polymer-forming cytoskeletal protein [Leucothrix mucor]|uniref:Polymer-forming cytoskeletal protein n=1 Tax=Leucothrix mucor TaxID=45248 RepID=A0A7V2WUK6_LEUMU|nr:polymer-forming cytoskeletal protein [Leucothrix mucor]